ncbi:MAG: FAD-binding protein [Rhodobacteraceae bacterium]|nr:FAD-binding protein [Paracoccaceae bacterium]MBR9822475.1 FAD-binding protein [Paracoccaceae bacterium]
MQVDVAIIGGGPAGCAAALTLGKRPDIRTLLIERGDYSRAKVGESLSPGVRSLLQYLGLWERFDREQRHSLMGNEAAWGSEDLGAMDFIFTLHGAGWALDRRAFEAMLAEEAEAAGATLWRETSVGACTWHGTQWRIGTTRGAVTARYLLDAAGRTSGLSLAQGARRLRNDTLVALCAVLPRAGRMAQVTRVEAVPEGWWYAAPLPSGAAMCCLFTDAGLSHAAGLADPARWSQALARTRHIAPLLRAEAPQVQVLPAFSGLLSDTNPALPMVAAGDAAAARDPLSSSGIPNAMASGIQAARVAADHLFGSGALAQGYRDSLLLDHQAYLRAHWRTYRTETRWPEAPFWRFRAAQARRAPGAVVRRRAVRERSIFVPGPVSDWIRRAASEEQTQLALMTRARAAFPALPDERLMLAVEELTEPV